MFRFKSSGLDPGLQFGDTAHPGDIAPPLIPDGLRLPNIPIVSLLQYTYALRVSTVLYVHGGDRERGSLLTYTTTGCALLTWSIREPRFSSRKAEAHHSRHRNLGDLSRRYRKD